MSGEQGRGTFVRDTTLSPGHGIDQQAVAADVVDLNFNYPSLPGQADLLRTAAARARHGRRPRRPAALPAPSAGDRTNGLGRPASRRAGCAVDAERVLIVNGAQHGLAVTVMAMLQPATSSRSMPLTYPGFKVLAETLAARTGARCPSAATAPTSTPSSGCARPRRVRAVYTMPTLHNPLGWVMTRRRPRPAGRDRPAARAADHRGRRLRLPRRRRRHRRSPRWHPELTVHVSGLSKSVATGLRVGFVVGASGLGAGDRAGDPRDHLEHPRA